jgi:RNA polymerase sigma-54 factor
MPMGMVLQPAQKQQLNARLVQQMKLLQMNGQELENYIAKAVEENPVLDFPEASEEWQEQGPSFRQASGPARAADDDPLPNPVENAHQEKHTLEEVLIRQLGCLTLSQKEERLAYYLIGTLDAAGYWKGDLKKTAGLFGVKEDAARRLLTRIQHFEPTGVAAGSLKECLLLQLEPETEENSLARRIIEEGLELLADNRIPELASRFGVTRKEILVGRDLIRTLDPKPGALYRQENPTVFLHEDAFVECGPQGLKLTVYNPWGGQLVLNRHYLSIAEETDSEKIRAYLKEQIGKAKALQHLIKGRYETLRLILEALVTHEEAFFRWGPGHKAPLRLADLAEETGMAVSTVSRALQNKVIACRWGAYEAGDFLMGTAGGDGETAGTTDEQIELAIRHIVDGEDKRHPLSDQAICDCLKKEGIVLARRTVNKYRTKLGIPGKAARKSWE